MGHKLCTGDLCQARAKQGLKRRWSRKGHKGLCIRCAKSEKLVAAKKQKGRRLVGKQKSRKAAALMTLRAVQAPLTELTRAAASDGQRYRECMVPRCKLRARKRVSLVEYQTSCARWPKQQETQPVVPAVEEEVLEKRSAAEEIENRDQDTAVVLRASGPTRTAVEKEIRRAV